MIWSGIFDLPWWGYVLAALGMTHITIASVTIFLHRHQAHRALDLHPAVSHFFRAWLWLTTGMITREWVAVHRKHHARVESPEDPHSPRQYGIHRVLWLGALLYRREAACAATLATYGHGTPDDWLERKVYAPHNGHGIALLAALNMLVFGIPAGAVIWVVQMAWIPFWAAGVINGLGHYFGYRNFEVQDASTNIVPWGFIIGGEELHNNHHAYASSARFSCRPFEIDIGWWYIRALAALGLARVNKTVPRFRFEPQKLRCDLDTVRALTANRIQMMANFSREVLNRVYQEELDRVRRTDHALRDRLVRARSALRREASLLDEGARHWLASALAESDRLRTVCRMRDSLQEVWRRSATTHDAVLRALEDWRRQAEASGIQALREFSRRLPTYALASA